MSQRMTNMPSVLPSRPFSMYFTQCIGFFMKIYTNTVSEIDCYCLQHTAPPNQPYSYCSAVTFSLFFSLYILAPIPCDRPMFFRTPTVFSLSLSLLHTRTRNTLNKHIAFWWVCCLFKMYFSPYFVSFAADIQTPSDPIKALSNACSQASITSVIFSKGIINKDKTLKKVYPMWIRYYIFLMNPNYFKPFAELQGVVSNKYQFLKFHIFNGCQNACTLSVQLNTT